MNYFDKYVSSYDMNDKDISYKYYHSYRVRDNMELLAKHLKLSDKDIKLAKIIGLLHDIGRFEQDRLYNSFKDGQFDHGDYGANILINDRLIKNFDIDESDYNVVYQAIRNHNKYAIDSNLNERELLFCKMVRDVDKLDILYALGNDKILTLSQDNSSITKEAAKKFFDNEQILIKNNQTKSDNLVLIFSLAYDLNYNISFNIISDNHYYDLIFNRLNNKRIFKPYIEHINKYVSERIDNNVR